MSSDNTSSDLLQVFPSFHNFTQLRRGVKGEKMAVIDPSKSPEVKQQQPPFKVIIIHNKTHYPSLSTCTCSPLVFKWVCCRRRSFKSIGYCDFTVCGLITAYYSLLSEFLLSVLHCADVTDVAIAFASIQYFSSWLFHHFKVFVESRIASLCTICDAVTIHILLRLFLFWIITLQSGYVRLWCRSLKLKQAVLGVRWVIF